MRKCQMRVFSCSPKANLNPWPLKNEHIDTDLHHPRLLIRTFNIQRYISATDVIGSCPLTHREFVCVWRILTYWKYFGFIEGGRLESLQEEDDSSPIMTVSPLILIQLTLLLKGVLLRNVLRLKQKNDLIRITLRWSELQTPDVIIVANDYCKL